MSASWRWRTRIGRIAFGWLRRSLKSSAQPRRNRRQKRPRARLAAAAFPSAPARAGASATPRAGVRFFGESAWRNRRCGRPVSRLGSVVGSRRRGRVEEWDVELGDGALYRTLEAPGRLVCGGLFMTAPPYVELHARSAFSFLRGASFPEQLAERAAELELPAMALCDRDGRLRRAALFMSKGKECGVRADRRRGTHARRRRGAAGARRVAHRLSESLPADHAGETARDENRCAGALERAGGICRRSRRADRR